jgi:hypothetical protein
MVFNKLVGLVVGVLAYGSTEAVDWTTLGQALGSGVPVVHVQV